ncbi:hypothetical protein Tco_0797279 [Tanacetum coccineum]
MTPPPSFSTPPQIPNINTSVRPPVTTTVFATTTPENTPFAYRASTSANPNPIISPAFVEANYEDYDEERKMEPRPRPTRETTLPLWSRSPGVRRQRERVVGFKEASNREGSRAGLRTRSLVEHLSTDLPSTYKGLMEKTYMWIEAREVATNGAPNDQREKFKRSKKSSWDNNRGHKNKDMFSPYRGPNHGFLSSLSKSLREILPTEKVARSFEQPPRQLSHLVKGIKKKRAKSSKNRVEGKKDKVATPTKAPILMIRKKESYTRDNVSEDSISESREITFPSVTRGNNLSAPVIIKAKVFGREVGQVHMDSGSSYETTMQKMEIIVFTIHGAIKFHTAKGIGTVFSTHESDKIKEGMKKVREMPPESTLR